jgi:nucleoside-diphosphate-sugar epimerase
MRIFVTGATGFVGAAVARALLRRGHEVTGLIRDPARADALRAAGMSVAVGDMWNPETYREAPAEADVVIHAAQDKAPGRWTRRATARMHESDALMTRVLAQGCQKHDRRFLYTSGGLNYTGQGDAWLDESASVRPCLLARGHAEMVAELDQHHRRDGLDVVVITPGLVYGAGGMLAGTIAGLRRGSYRVMGDGANYWSLVHVDDLAELYALAVERSRPGENYFAADDCPMTRREMIDRLAKALGVPRAGWIPAFLVALTYGSAMVEAIRVSMRLRNDKAKRDLGWTLRYPTFDQGLPAVLAEMGLSANSSGSQPVAP